MNPLSNRIAAVMLLVGLAVPAVAAAQDRSRAAARGSDSQGRQRAPGPTSGGRADGGQARERAVPRAMAPPPATTTRAEPTTRSEAPPNAPQQPRAVERARGTDADGRVRAPRPQDADDGARNRAEPRERAVAVAPPATRADEAGDAAPNAAEEEQRRRAGRRGGRDRGDNPAVGRAVPRNGDWDRDGGGSRRGYPVYSSRGRIGTNTYYYPRRWYPYGYGAFGLGYFYYDPYTWYPYDPYYGTPYYGSPYYGGYGGYGYRGDSDYDTGELRLQVRPRDAEVYVDGYFAGRVDDFDGVFQGLRLEEGAYTIEIVAPRYEALEFKVRIQPGRKTTYRGELRPRL